MSAVSLLLNFSASGPIPPCVDSTSGVNVAFSTSIIRWFCTLQLYMMIGTIWAQLHKLIFFWQLKLSAKTRSFNKLMKGIVTSNATSRVRILLFRRSSLPRYMVSSRPGIVWLQGHSFSGYRVRYMLRRLCQSLAKINEGSDSARTRAKGLQLPERLSPWNYPRRLWS